MVNEHIADPATAASATPGQVIRRTPRLPWPALAVVGVVMLLVVGSVVSLSHPASHVVSASSSEAAEGHLVGLGRIADARVARTACPPTAKGLWARTSWMQMLRLGGADTAMLGADGLGNRCRG
jgi:hypothetical protein